MTGNNAYSTYFGNDKFFNFLLQYYAIAILSFLRNQIAKLQSLFNLIETKQEMKNRLNKKFVW